MRLHNTKWYSIITVIITSTFLLVLSTVVLSLIVKQYSIMWASSTESRAYIASEWALEYTLLKLKNHREWFQDSLTKQDSNKDMLFKAELSYKIESNSLHSTWDIKKWDYKVIPLFTDDWSLIDTNEKSFDLDLVNNIKNVTSLKFKADTKISWNLVGSEWSIAWLLTSWTELNNTTSWVSKKYDISTKKFNISNIQISNFLNTNKRVYLVLFNVDNNDSNYTLDTNLPHALSVTKIIASAKSWKFRQNLSFEIDNSSSLDYLAFSFISL